MPATSTRTRPARTAAPPPALDLGTTPAVPWPRQVLRLTTWCAVLAAAHLAVRAAGQVLPTPPAPGAGLLAWLGRADPVTTAFALLRLVALALCWYLTALTALAVLARLSGLRILLQVADRITVPAVRRVLRHAVGTGLAVAIAGSTIPLFAGGSLSTAGAEPAPPVVTMRVIDESPAPTVNSSSDSGRPPPPDLAPSSADPPPSRPSGDGPVVQPDAPSDPTPPSDADDPNAPVRMVLLEDPPPTDLSSTPQRDTPPTHAPAAATQPAAAPAAPAADASPPAADAGRASAPDRTDAQPPPPAAAAPASTPPTMREAVDTAPPPVARPAPLPSDHRDADATPVGTPGPGDTAASNTEGDAPPAPAPAATDPSPREWTVQAGDHLWHIAEMTLQHTRGHAVSDREVGDYWRTLIDANRDRLIVPGDADLILPGQRFVLPPIPTVPATAPTGA